MCCAVCFLFSLSCYLHSRRILCHFWSKVWHAVDFNIQILQSSLLKVFETTLACQTSDYAVTAECVRQLGDTLVTSGC